jgi:uncharacterized protein YndB with AHSA1/START domain
MPVDANVIERVVRIAARPETVYAHLTESALYVRWKGREADLDPRPGGIFRVRFEKDVARGEFVEAIPYRRVVFTWGWEGNPITPPGSSRVEIDLEPDGEGTRLRLVHSGLPVETLAGHTEGWDHFLPRLAEVAAGKPLPA